MSSRYYTMLAMHTPDAIARYKREAAKALQGFRAQGEGIDCGNAMLKHVRPEAQRYADAYNAAMANLKAIDPNCPEYEPL